MPFPSALRVPFRPDAKDEHHYPISALVTAPPEKAVGGTVKRSFDIVTAITALVVLAPLLLVVAMMIRLFDEGPALYRHRRIGRNGMPFDCLKFRTMVVDADRVLHRQLLSDREAAREWERDHKLKNDPRITPLGHILRKTSVDELPQLFNVLRGEMSFVGPRPIVSEEISKYGTRIADYLRARPGMTGKWQVSGRNDVGYEERVELDWQYVAQWSLLGDLAILVRTVFIVISARGCY